MRKLLIGDNLGVLRDFVENETVDLVYLDPPFNSKRDYNLLYAASDHRTVSAQIQAFTDTWGWDQQTQRAYRELTTDRSLSVKHPKLGPLIAALHDFLGENDVMAYLVMMAIRIVELHRVLKPEGTIYLHCDATAVHYLKVIMDAIFGFPQFRNDLVWKRKAGRGETNKAAIRFGVSHDNLLMYAKSPDAMFNRQHRPNNPAYIASKFVHVEPDGRRYRLDNLTSPSPRPNLRYEYKGHAPPKNGWAVSPERMAEMDAEGRLYIPADPTKRIQRKRFLDELEGETVDSLWDDIPPVNSQAHERLGYPTQKPVALLQRIIAASSRPGDVVLDPFCGCGTTIEAAEKMGRSWIGIDIATLAISTILSRVEKVFGEDFLDRLDAFDGNPADIESARLLAERNKYGFQDWAVRFVHGRAPGGHKRSKKGRDAGIDGELLFRVGGEAGTVHRAIVSVKGGAVNPAAVRDLHGTVTRERCSIGVLITALATTREMRKEAAKVGDVVLDGQRFPRIQLLTLDDLFNLRLIKHPGENVTGVTAPIEQLLLFDKLQGASQARERGTIKDGVAKSRPPASASSAADTELAMAKSTAKKRRRVGGRTRALAR